LSAKGLIGVIAAGAMGVTAAMAQPADSYLLRVEQTLELCRADVPALAPVADAAAQRLATGGKLYLAGQASMVSELTGRAGGIMLAKPLGATPPAADDVILFFPEGQAAAPEAWAAAAALVVVMGAHIEGWPSFSNHASALGVSPTLANAIPGWLFTGELVAALTRLGKMPVLYESIGAYDGMPRIAQYERQGIFFHDDHAVAPVEAGVLSNEYIDQMKALLRRIEKEERDALDRTGAWIRAAREGGHALYMYSMGHLFPDEVGRTEIGTIFRSATWNAGFRRSVPPDDAFESGDVVVHIGYQHPPRRLLDRAIPQGAKVSYVSVRPDRDYNREDVIWIDPMWPWEDALVPIPGYDVPALASSGILNGAIAWEIYRIGTGTAP
jgi:hypothetical protein